MESVWYHTFINKLCIDPSEHKVLLTDSPLAPISDRQKMAVMMFEKFSVPAVYIMTDAVLALYAHGRTTGVVLDVGDTTAYTVPVYQGYVLRHAIGRPVCGRDLTDYMGQLLSDAGHSFTTKAEWDLVRDIKESYAYVAANVRTEKEKFDKDPNTARYYHLPDGRAIEINDQQFRCPEALFNPSILGKDTRGVHSIIYDSVMKCDAGIRPNLFTNIVLSGRSTLFPGLSDRLSKEIFALAPPTTKVIIAVMFF